MKREAVEHYDTSQRADKLFLFPQETLPRGLSATDSTARREQTHRVHGILETAAWLNNSMLITRFYLYSNF